MSDKQSVTVHAPGKVNLQLNVGGRRTDGYHEIATIFLAVSCYDKLVLRRSSGLRVTVSGTGAGEVPADDSNLAGQAIKAVAKMGGVEPDVHIHIHKRIPVQGGMGGGSSDAAGALLGGDALWQLGIGRAGLMSLAEELGSDVPFSMLGGVALGRGRGEALQPLTSGITYHWVFAVAGFGLSTPAVFGAHERHRQEAGLPFAAGCLPAPQVSPRLIDALACGDVDLVAQNLTNDLEFVASRMRPELTGTLTVGRGAGALAGFLCGTGATTAFLVPNESTAHDVAEALLASETCASVRIARGPVQGPRIGKAEEF